MKNREPFRESAEESTGFLLWQVTALWQRKIAAALRPFGLTQVQYALLASLLWISQTESQITQSMLARILKLDLMMTSQVLTKLEAKGFVARRPHPTDTRAKVVQLTAEGKMLVRKAIPAVETADAAFFKELAQERAIFNTQLRLLIKAHEKESL